jgi:glucose uptake protein
MYIVTNLSVAIFLCVLTMIGWGSWANTQKLAGKDEWRFELYYWDYAFGVLLFSLLWAFTAGSTGTAGQPFLENLAQADSEHMMWALLSGALFNLSNILLVVAIDAAGMAVAFPVGVGLAAVIGTISSYVQAPKGNAMLLFTGVALLVAAMAASSVAHSRLPRKTVSASRGLLFAILAGALMGFFYPQLLKAITPNFISSPVSPGTLTPYAALVLFAAGMVLSNIIFNTVLMRAGGLNYSDYFRGTAKLHAIGIAGGVIWMMALSFNVLASGVAGPAVSYALGQGATLVASIWGVFIWREFKNAPPGTGVWIGLMFAGYIAGITLIGAATL